MQGFLSGANASSSSIDAILGRFGSELPPNQGQGGKGANRGKGSRGKGGKGGKGKDDAAQLADETTE